MSCARKRGERTRGRCARGSIGDVALRLANTVRLPPRPRQPAWPKPLKPSSDRCGAGGMPRLRRGPSCGSVRIRSPTRVVSRHRADGFEPATMQPPVLRGAPPGQDGSNPAPTLSARLDQTPQTIFRSLRRGRDSNPRWAFDPRPLSKRVPSTTRSPLRFPRCGGRTVALCDRPSRGGPEGRVLPGGGSAMRGAPWWSRASSPLWP